MIFANKDAPNVEEVKFANITELNMIVLNVVELQCANMVGVGEFV
jgi:hypothetical protein